MKSGDCLCSSQGKSKDCPFHEVEALRAENALLAQSNDVLRSDKESFREAAWVLNEDLTKVKALLREAREMHDQCSVGRSCDNKHYKKKCGCLAIPDLLKRIDTALGEKEYGEMSPSAPKGASPQGEEE